MNYFDNPYIRMSHTEAEWLHQWVGLHHITNAIEIGRDKGGSTGLLLDALKGHLISIDIKNYFDDSLIDHLPEGLRSRLCFITANSQNHKAKQIIRSEFYRYTPVDLIFIDGDHSYEAVQQDYNNFLPFLNKSGVVILHDYRKEEGVTMFVDDGLDTKKFNKFHMFESMVVLLPKRYVDKNTEPEIFRDD